MTEVEEAKKAVEITRERVQEALQTFFFGMNSHQARLDSIFRLEEWKEENLNSQELDDFIGEIQDVLYTMKAEAEDLEMLGEDLENDRIDLEDAEADAQADAPQA